MRNIGEPGLYVVTEENLAKEKTNEDIVKAAISGGAAIIQLREKDWPKEKYREEAIKLSGLCRELGVPFVVNDYPDIAKEVQADALHLGQEDMPLEEARAIVGEGIALGKSTHSLEQALDAEREGADYISIGPVFPTRKKPNPIGVETVRQVAQAISIPFVAIGGIKTHNVQEVLDAGARTVAVISAVVEAEDPKAATEEFVDVIRRQQEEER